MKNRSVPADILLPHVSYQNLDSAIAWLNRVFGFEEHYRYGNPLSGAQLHLGNAWIMVNAAKPGFSSPAQIGSATQSLTIFVEDVDAHYERTKAAGAKILEHPHETVYGEYQYATEDLGDRQRDMLRHADAAKLTDRPCG
jgi:uncharacterized glyoxalase superfamily protein PhnB